MHILSIYLWFKTLDTDLYVCSYNADEVYYKTADWSCYLFKMSACVPVYICVYVCIHMCLHMCELIYAQMGTHIWICTHIHVDVCESMGICMYVWLCMCVHICVGVCLHMWVHVHLYVCTCVFAYLSLHICAHMGKSVQQNVWKAVPSHWAWLLLVVDTRVILLAF